MEGDLGRKVQPPVLSHGPACLRWPGRSGSKNAPTATPTTDGKRSGSHQTVDPHTPQKWKVTAAPLAAARGDRVSDPPVVMAGG